MRKGSALSVFVVLLLFVVGELQSVYGFAYRLPTQSTHGLSKGNAVATDLEDPSSVYYNAAATAYAPGIQSTSGALFVTNQVQHEYKVADVDEESHRKNYFIPNSFTTINLKELGLEPVTMGFGVASPYGLGLVYKQNSPIAPVVEKAEIKVANYLLTSAYKVNDQFSVGAGIDIAHTRAELQNRVDFGALVGAPRTMDGISEVKGSDNSVGFNTSVLFRPWENHSFAATFRSEQVAKLEGKAKTRYIPAFVGVGSSLEGAASARLKYPAVIQGAYGYQLGKLKLEFMLDWTNWATVETLEVKSTIGNTVYDSDFNNVFTYNAGATYELLDWLNANVGFIWAETPIPDRTFNAIVPDSDRFALSCGLEMKFNALQVDTGFQWAHFEGRNISNDVGAPLTTLDGNYSTDAFLVGVNATYRF